MPWDVEFHETYAAEFADLDPEVRVEIEARVILLRQFGPQLGRPHVDTLKGSRHANMKELRFNAADGAWRIAFAFDPRRTAILLVGGGKSGISERRFYKQLIASADSRYSQHVATLDAEGG